MDRLKMFSTIAVQAGHGELRFPTNVNASLKLKRILDDPECNLEEAAKLLMKAPLIAARIVALANSAAYNRSNTEITSVYNAVMRLGFQPLHTLVVAEVVKEFEDDISDSTTRAKAAQLWEHTAHVAALARVLAKYVTHLDPETAMFAGIVHEIGGFYLLFRAHDFPGLLEGASEAWQGFGEKAIGRRVLGKLSVPATVTAAVESLWFAPHKGYPVTLGDTLMLANTLAPVMSPLQDQGLARKPSDPPIDFEVGEDNTLQNILVEKSDEIKTLTASLLI
jgi:hypothetical protein